MKPQTTLREFLGNVTPRFGGATTPFGELTGLAERALYSLHTPEMEEVARAESLSRMVEEELRR